MSKKKGEKVVVLLLSSSEGEEEDEPYSQQLLEDPQPLTQAVQALGDGDDNGIGDDESDTSEHSHPLLESHMLEPQTPEGSEDFSSELRALQILGKLDDVAGINSALTQEMGECGGGSQDKEEEAAAVINTKENGMEKKASNADARIQAEGELKRVKNKEGRNGAIADATGRIVAATDATAEAVVRSEAEGATNESNTGHEEDPHQSDLERDGNVAGAVQDLHATGEIKSVVGSQSALTQELEEFGGVSQQVSVSQDSYVYPDSQKSLVRKKEDPLECSEDRDNGTVIEQETQSSSDLLMSQQIALTPLDMDGQGELDSQTVVAAIVSSQGSGGSSSKRTTGSTPTAAEFSSSQLLASAVSVRAVPQCRPEDSDRSGDYYRERQDFQASQESQVSSVCELMIDAGQFSFQNGLRFFR